MSAARGRRSTTGWSREAQGGEIVLRIEDTDPSAPPRRTSSRSTRASAGSTSTGTRSPVSQAERADRHKEEIERPLDEGPRLQKKKKKKMDDGAVRLRVPDEGFYDGPRRGSAARSSFEHQAIDDFVVARSDGSSGLPPRGGGRRPRHGHHPRRPRRRPLLEHPQAAADPARRSGAAGLRPPAAASRHRRQEALQAPRRGSVQELRDAGYLPEAVRNYLALLGWGYDAETRSPPPTSSSSASRSSASRSARACSTRRSCAG